jgi:hypothetical protein
MNAAPEAFFDQHAMFSYAKHLALKARCMKKEDYSFRAPSGKGELNLLSLME